MFLEELFHRSRKMVGATARTEKQTEFLPTTRILLESGLPVRTFNCRFEWNVWEGYYPPTLAVVTVPGQSLSAGKVLYVGPGDSLACLALGGCVG